jgi:hypothetical protein
MQIWGGEAATMDLFALFSCLFLLISDKNGLTACHPVSGVGPSVLAPPSWPTVLVLLSVPSTVAHTYLGPPVPWIQVTRPARFCVSGLCICAPAAGRRDEKKKKNATVTSHRVARGSGAGIPSLSFPPARIYHGGSSLKWTDAFSFSFMISP